MTPDLATLGIYLTLGAGVGLLAGLLGVGGGLIIVPVLVMEFHAAHVPAHVIMHLAIGTSLATIVLTSSASVYTHHRHRAVLWPVVAWITPGIVVGALLSSWFASLMHSDGLKIILVYLKYSLPCKWSSAFGLRPAVPCPAPWD